MRASYVVHETEPSPEEAHIQNSTKFLEMQQDTLPQRSQECVGQAWFRCDVQVQHKPAQPRREAVSPTPCDIDFWAKAVTLDASSLESVELLVGAGKVAVHTLLLEVDVSWLHKVSNEPNFHLRLTHCVDRPASC